VRVLTCCARSSQDLKDYMRQAGEVTYADAHKDTRGEGIVEFACGADLRRAMDKLDDTDLNGRRIRLVDQSLSRRRHSRSRSRSRSRHSRSRSRSRGSRSRSRDRSQSKEKEYRKSRSKSRSRSASRSRSRSAPRDNGGDAGEN